MKDVKQKITKKEKSESEELPRRRVIESIDIKPFYSFRGELDTPNYIARISIIIILFLMFTNVLERYTYGGLRLEIDILGFGTYTYENLGLVFEGVLVLMMLVFFTQVFVALNVKRLRNIGASYSILYLLLIPGVNIFVFLYIAFARPRMLS